MATFIPKNAKQILTNAAKARDYFLKPYGLDVIMLPNRLLLTKIFPESTPNINSSRRRYF